MDTSLLTIKLQVPRQPPHAVFRSRLIDAIENGLNHYKLILLSAPAGYGKTTLLSQWARTSHFPVSWLSISEEDNSLESVLQYLLAGWEQVWPGIGASPLGLLLGGQLPASQAILPVFVNAASAANQPVVFVLDDYHLIKNASIHQGLTFLLDHLPHSLHFILASRGEPPLPLGRYRAHSEMLELRASELTFLPKEAQVFLEDKMGIDLEPEEIVPLCNQLEGWIAGLQLVALTMNQGKDREGRLVVSGRHRFIADYLNEDVFARLPQSIQQFLLQTSILDRLCGALCEAVTGLESGQETLETLEAEGLFLVSLDENREWFRYHHLFADFLYEELKRRYPQDLDKIHRRAARWYLTSDLAEPAFYHAVQGKSLDLVTQIIERYVPVKLMTGEIRTVKQWLDRIPAAWYADRPELGLAQVFFLAVTGAFDACLHRLDDVEQSLLALELEDTRRQLARATGCRCLVACLQNNLAQAVSYASQALQNLPEEDVFFRSGIYHSLGDLFRQNGRWREAEKNYLKVLEFADHPSARFRKAHIYGALADLDLRQGHLKQAAAYWNEALAAIQEPESRGRVPLPVTGWVYIRTGEIQYEWNQVSQAWDYLRRGLEYAELGGDLRARIAGYLLAGRLKLTQGDDQGAAEYLEKARPLLEEAQFPHWTSRFEHLQLELWLARGRLRAAIDWAEELLLNDARLANPETELSQLALARVMIVKGNKESIERGLALLEHLLRVAGAEDRMGVQIEAMAYQALAFWRLGDRTTAMTTLEEGLRLAEPQGYIRLFVDLGLPIGRLLQEARSRQVLPDYVGMLLNAFDGDLSYPGHTQPALTEPLTARENQVLELLAAGLTNREIAEKLVISPETVKKHAGNIYGKLNVSTRTEAAARARALDLLN